MTSDSHYLCDMPTKSDNADKLDEFFSMRVSARWYEMVDDLRAMERPLLTRAAFVKKIIEDLHAERGGSKRRRA